MECDRRCAVPHPITDVELLIGGTCEHRVLEENVVALLIGFDEPAFALPQEMLNGAVVNYCE